PGGPEPSGGAPHAQEPPEERGVSAEPPGARGAERYRVKWIRWKGERTPVVTQSQNGPCPLLAIINTLLLRWKARGAPGGGWGRGSSLSLLQVKLPPQKEVITAEELMAHLGDCILSTQPRETSEGLQLNFQQNINDTMTVLPKLSTGLDVNVRFTGVSDFEYTPECIVFDLLNIPLYHGWLVDPQGWRSSALRSWGSGVDKGPKLWMDSPPLEGSKARLDGAWSDLGWWKVLLPVAGAGPDDPRKSFSDSDPSGMFQGHLYLLVTDQGFLREEGVVWESLHTVDGDSCFCDTDFHLSHAPGKGGDPAAPPDHGLQQRHVDQDYMVALSLQQQQGQDPPSVLSDLELARQLQHEEYQQHRLHPPPPPPPPPQQQGGGRPAGERRQRQRPDLDCTLL
ncbi:MINY1 hydrolase, partial [Sclerurus mexicanus]|nr:MINY1 hydrolase [Sclerurus mexicanus]